MKKLAHTLAGVLLQTLLIVPLWFASVIFIAVMGAALGWSHNDMDRWLAGLTGLTGAIYVLLVVHQATS